MATNFTLTDYMPTPDELDPQDIIDARQRAVTYLSQWWAELDTRPNSVFGDLYLTPYAVMLAALEVAISRWTSDLNLANVARGIVYNPTFVSEFLKNFGVAPNTSINATGVVKLTFSTNQSYVLSADTTFSFNGNIFVINPDEGNPVVIYPTGTTDGKRVLVQETSATFVVFLPMTGPSGAAVADGSEASTSLTFTELTGVQAAGDFDSGLAAESLASLAQKAQTGFPSANLTSRSGALSFLVSRYPQMVGASVVLTGDREMIRDNLNPLGVAEGAVDIYLRSRKTYAFGESILKLVYDTNQSGWVGQLVLPVTPAFFALQTGNFQVSNFNNNRGVNFVYAQSSHPQIDNLGIAYSSYETLGLLLGDAQPDNFNPAALGDIRQVSGDDSVFSVSGLYAGYLFSASTARSVTLRFDGVELVNALPAARISVRDNLNGDTAQLFIVGDTALSPTKGIVLKDINYTKMFNGLEISIMPRSNAFVPANLIGNTYEFSFQGRTAEFSINYLYDPALIQVNSVIQDPDNKPAGVSILTKSFVICHIQNFTVNYRARFGDVVDRASAQQDIFDYLNTIVYPDVYEESRIGEILLRYGATGIQSVNKQATIYPSLASYYVSKDNTVTNITPVATTTLLAPASDQGFGPRNMAYLINQTDIQFNASVY